MTFKAMNPTPGQMQVVRAIVSGAIQAFMLKLNEKTAANPELLFQAFQEFAAESHLLFDKTDVEYWSEVVSVAAEMKNAV